MKKWSVVVALVLTVLMIQSGYTQQTNQEFPAEAMDEPFITGEEPAISITSPVQRNTHVTIVGDMFYINDVPTYQGRYWTMPPGDKPQNGQTYKIEGLLMNSRMVQGIFDDLNPSTRSRWAYPDTGEWDPDRNTQEFIAAMPSWYAHGMLAFTLNLQGGSPEGYSQAQPWINSAFAPDGSLRPEYMARLEQIIDRADELGMVVILGYFYFGQDHRLPNETAILNAVDNATNWILDKGYRNVIIEINNECDLNYNHDILAPLRVHELIQRVQNTERDGYSLYASTSYKGGVIPGNQVIAISDFILIHGNSVHVSDILAYLIRQTRSNPHYTPKPIIINEDDHYNFSWTWNNYYATVSEYASWGFFDWRRTGEGFDYGFQSMPTNWQISSPIKQGFFNLTQTITGGQQTLPPPPTPTQTPIGHNTPTVTNTPTIAAVPNLIINPGFEDNTSGAPWQLGSLTNSAIHTDSSNAHSGQRFLEVNTSGSPNNNFYQDVNLSLFAGDQYSGSIWVRSPSGNSANLGFVIWFLGSSNQNVINSHTIPQGNNSWHQLTLTATVPQGTFHTIRVQVYLDTNSVNYNFDDAALHQLSTSAFVEENGLVVMEVESVPPTGDWEFRTAFAGYSGSGYYIWTGPDYFYTPGYGKLEYPIYITTPGNYRLSIRNRHEHEDPTEENDCFTRMNDGVYSKLYSPERGVWNWNVNHEHGDHTHTQPRYYLEAGLNVLTICGRSNNFMIDRIHLFLDSVSNPFSLAHPESQRSSFHHDTPTPTQTPSPTATPTPTIYYSPTNTPTPNLTPATATMTPTPTLTATATPTMVDAPNLLTNPGFEDNTSGEPWQLTELTNKAIYTEPSNAHSGQRYLQTNTSGSPNNNFYQDVNLSLFAGDQYSGSIWVKIPSGNSADLRFVIWFLGSSNEATVNTHTTPQGDSNWHQLTLTATVPQGTFTKIRMQVYLDTNSVNYSFDDAALHHLSTATPQPTPTSASDNTPTPTTVVSTPTPTIPPGAEGAFVEENGLLVIEVESVPPTGDWEFRTDFSGYSGTGYYIWTGPDYFHTPGHGILEYPIYINNPGNYRLSLRNRHEHPDHTEENDCWTKMDDGPYIKLYSPERAVWTWWVNHEHADHTHTEARYQLSQGLHTFIISGRSNNFMIDRMHFYLDSVQDPLSLSHPESPRMGSDYTPAPTLAPTNTPSNTPTRTPSRTPSNTPTRTPTSPATSTPTWTRTFTPTNTPTRTPAGPNMTATVTVLMGRPGDANRDLFVNAEDFRTVRDYFGQARWDIGDANADGFVNSADFRAVRDNFGRSYVE